MRWTECVAGIGENKYSYRDLFAKPEIERQPGRYRLTWAGNIEIK